MKVERANVPLPYTEFLIQPFGPNGLSQLLNYDIIGFPEEGNQIELVGGAEWLALQSRKLRVLKLLTPIKGTFGLSTLTLRRARTAYYTLLLLKTSDVNFKQAQNRQQNKNRVGEGCKMLGDAEHRGSPKLKPEQQSG